MHKYSALIALVMTTIMLITNHGTEHVHSPELNIKNFDEKHTEYYEGERPYTDGLEFSLTCSDCGEELPLDDDVICETGRIARDDTSLVFRSGEYTAELPVTVNPVRRIAFVGDSITHGVWGTAFPTYVKKALRKNVDVGNFGVSGIAVTGWGGSWNDPDFRYIKQDVFDEVLAFEPDLIFVMLGTNDAGNWDEALKTFDGDYEALLTAFVETGAEVIVLPPMPVTEWNTFALPNEIISDRVMPHEKAVAEKLGLEFYDTNAILTEYTPDGYYTDGVHLSESGKAYFGGIMADKVREIYGIE